LITKHTRNKGYQSNVLSWFITKNIQDMNIKGGIGQSNNGNYSDGHGGGSATPHIDFGDFQRPAMGGIGGVNNQQVQQ
jgi:hypothetical protein